VRANDQPLPGDLVIRMRDDRPGPIAHTLFIVTVWPDADAIVGGPYQSLGTRSGRPA
jgi:hypothetical protein